MILSAKINCPFLEYGGSEIHFYRDFPQNAENNSFCVQRDEPFMIFKRQHLFSYLACGTVWIIETLKTL